ncbi:MAG: rRNA methyltransferase [Actinobacteria bacterium]|nr:rRNA methyltransferase [Actinomycetota bacterium]MBD30312.1 rRNA methyltransferase [Acidimicrobiaceae bacterium]|tara:strand:- start:11952 stop:12761 length:810 start_codon:yes stop_codon:yes gene_type:complete
MNEFFITKPEDERVADFVGLSNHKLRRLREKDGGDMAPYFIGEGIIVINRALAVGHKLLTLIVSEKFDHSQITAVPQECNVFRCSPSVLEAITGRPNLKDPIATFLRPPQNKFEELTREAELIVLTESVQNPTNMGMVMRNAAAFGVDAVFFDPQSCDPLYRRAVRVSMGQVFSVPHTQVLSIPKAISALTGKGFLTIALTPDPKSENLSAILEETSQSIALIIGSEGFGLSTNSLTAADCTAQIPMHNNVDSLNVATSLAIALYAVQN